MSIFLCLCDSCLFHTVCCKIFAKCIFQFYLLECNFFVWNGCVIFCEADISNILSCASLETIKLIHTECSCELTCTIRTEIKENNCVLIFDRSNRFPILCDGCWNEELICHIFCVGSIHCCNCTLCLFALSSCENIVCFFYTIPSVITIHSIVTSGDRSNLTNTKLCHLCFQCLDKSLSGSRCCITSV